MQPPRQRSIRLNRSGHLLLWERRESQVRLDDSELREQSFGLLFLDTWMDNDIVSRDPINRSGNAMLVARLKRVNNTEDLGGIAPCGGGVGHDQTNGLLRVDDEN